MGKDLRDFCIKNNLPFTVEFKEPWYPKPIEISPSDLNDTNKLMEIFNKAIFNDLIYGNVIFHVSDDQNV